MYENIYTNNQEFGGTLEEQFSIDIEKSNGIHIASGYVGASLISDFKDRFIKIGQRGTCKLLFGMVYHKGLREKQLDTLNSLDSLLRKDNPDNGVYISRKEYHGKIYKLENNHEYTVYVGSSNFSTHGFSTRDECTIQIDNTSTKTAISNYIDYLFKRDTTLPLSKVDISNKRPLTLTEKTLKDCEIKSYAYPHSKAIVGICRIQLRVDSQPVSSLNLFFGAGRKNQHGLHSPRPWYEVEITTQKTELSSEYYPKSKLLHPGKKTKSGNPAKAKTGSFIAYAEFDGKYYRISMKVGGDAGKDIYSADRSTFGELIKGKLERKGVLKLNDRITSETLHDYGRDYIEFKKINDKEYIIEF